MLAQGQAVGARDRDAVALEGADDQLLDAAAALDQDQDVAGADPPAALLGLDLLALLQPVADATSDGDGDAALGFVCDAGAVG